MTSTSSSSSSAGSSTKTVFVNAKAELKDDFGAVMFALHSHMLANGFKCVSVKESADEKEDKELDAAPADWSKSADGFYFKYKHSGLREPVILKALRMESFLIVEVATGGKSFSLELNVDDYVKRRANLSQHENLWGDLEKAVLLFDKNVVSKIAPKSTESDKDKGAKDKADAAAAGDQKREGSSSSEPARPRPGGADENPLLDPRFVPRQPQRAGDHDRDLDPMGPGLSPLGPGGVPMPGRGNLFGPESFGRGGRGGMAPRFDPFGPRPGIGGEPDFDELLPPGPLGPRPGGGSRGGGRGAGGFGRGGGGGFGGFGFGDIA